MKTHHVQTRLVLVISSSISSHKGTKLVVTGRIQTGNYTNKEGQKVYTTDVIVEECEFAESKKASESNESKAESQDDGFMNVPEDEIDSELPFN